MSTIFKGNLYSGRVGNMDKSDLIKAHAHCTNNYNELHNSKVCGCFYCRNIYNPNEIRKWIQGSELTAVCPYCNIDSVIGDAGGYPITKEFLKEMHKEWF